MCCSVYVQRTHVCPFAHKMEFAMGAAAAAAAAGAEDDAGEQDCSEDGTASVIWEWDRRKFCSLRRSGLRWFSVHSTAVAQAGAGMATWGYDW